MKMSEKEKLLEVQGLDVFYGDLQAVKDVNLEVKKGESLVIIGGSGTGKSVTLKCILGLLEPEKGSIIVDNTELVGAPHKTKEKINV